MLGYLQDMGSYVTDQKSKITILLEKSAQALRTPRDQQLVGTLKANFDVNKEHFEPSSAAKPSILQP